MTYSLRISLEGYNALTDTNLDHFALYADTDNILIKEYTRGTVSFSTTQYDITHSLGYIPMFLAFVYDPVGYIGPGSTWQQIGNANFSVAYWAFTTTSTLSLINGTGSSASYVYYIFYDQQA